MKSRNLQLTTLLFVMVVTCQIGYSQLPSGFNYQAVIRNSTGLPLATQNVSVRITLTDNTGTPVYYSEIFTTQTSAQGIVNLVIGTGSVQGQGVLSNVPWSTGNIWIKVEVDNGSGYTSMGLNKLQSVPFAQYAINGTWANEHTITSTANVAVDAPIFEVKNKLNQVVFGVYEGGVRVYVETSPLVKGSKGGFAVGGLSNKATTSSEYFRITPDSARVWIKAVPSVKGAKGGFAVGGLSNKGTTDDYFNVTPITTPLVINDNAQMLWYPLKEAFLVGRVQVLDPADVGYNSFASGYHSKAMGDYSQAMGYNSVASNTYATAIGQSCVASGMYSFAFGSQAQATNTNNIAIGYQTESSGTSDCYAFGKQAKVLSNSSNSYAFGNYAQVLSYSLNSYALGNTALVSGSTDSYAFGTNASVSNGLNSYAIGSNSKVWYSSGFTAWGSYAIGDHAETYGQRAYALGSHARALNNDAIAFGTNAKSTGYEAISIGANGSGPDTTYSTGQASIAMGYAANSGGSSSIAIGTRSIASKDYSIAIGYNASSTSAGGVAIGNGAIAKARNAYAIGSNAIASTENSISMGTNVNSGTAFTGSILIGDNSENILTPTGDNQFLVRASGGIKLFASSDMSTGVFVAKGSGSWSSISDVNKKTNFKDENPEDYLIKLSKINIQSWNYKSQNEAIRHIGVTAQDFYKNFQFGESDTTITDIDLAGVNMIAIKGLINRNNELTQKVTEQTQKIESLEKEYALLKSQIEIIKKFLSSPAKK
jgi:hypothetical protein